MTAKLSQPKRDIFFHSVQSCSVKHRTLRLPWQTYLLLPPIGVISHQKQLLILADTASVTIFMGWKVWEPGGFFMPSIFPLSPDLVVANLVMDFRMSSDNSEKPHHVAALSQCWERPCSGQAEWYTGHLPLSQPGPCLEICPLAPPYTPLPLPVFIEGGGTLSCSHIISAPREALGNIQHIVSFLSTAFCHPGKDGFWSASQSILGSSSPNPIYQYTNWALQTSIAVYTII